MTAALAVPSLGVVQKYLGLKGLVLYLPYVLLCVVIARSSSELLVASDSTRLCKVLFVVALLSITAAFIVLFPHADVRTPGRGGDANEAYDLAVRALPKGQYPYHVRTYLGNRVHPLPGALALATPFVVYWKQARSKACSGWPRTQPSSSLCWAGLGACACSCSSSSPVPCSGNRS